MNFLCKSSTHSHQVRWWPVLRTPEQQSCFELWEIWGKKHRMTTAIGISHLLDLLSLSPSKLENAWKPISLIFFDSSQSFTPAAFGIMWIKWIGLKWFLQKDSGRRVKAQSLQCSHKCSHKYSNEHATACLHWNLEFLWVPEWGKWQFIETLGDTQESNSFRKSWQGNQALRIQRNQSRER